MEAEGTAKSVSIDTVLRVFQYQRNQMVLTTFSGSIHVELYASLILQEVGA